MAKYFITPFASSGNKTDIPNSTAGNEVNYLTGYGEKYSADPDPSSPNYDPDALYVEAENENQIKFDITENLKLWQENLYPEFITSVKNDGVPFSYGRGMKVSLSGVNYISLVDDNTSEPPSGDWELYIDKPIRKKRFKNYIPDGALNFWDEGFFTGDQYKESFIFNTYTVSLGTPQTIDPISKIEMTTAEAEALGVSTLKYKSGFSITSITNTTATGCSS